MAEGFRLEEFSLVQKFVSKKIVRAKAESHFTLSAAWDLFSSCEKGMPKKRFKGALILVLGLAGIPLHDRVHQREGSHEQWLRNVFKGFSLCAS